MKDLTFAIAQINPTVGDIDGNAQKILAHYKQAAAQKADLVIFPELCLIGYPPEDLVLTSAFTQKAMRAAQGLAKATAKGPAMLIGCPWQDKDKTYNAALLLDHGKIAATHVKTLLPNYGIFDEKRIFSAGVKPKPISWRGTKLGILICEEVWNPELAALLKRQGAKRLIVINASPFETGKLEQRKKIAAAAAKKAKLPLIYANMVGGQDDIVFDGGSFVMDAKGKITAQLPEFKEALEIIPPPVGGRLGGGHDTRDLPTNAPLPTSPLRGEEQIWRAMMLGLSDYVHKNGFQKVVLGISGGIDSALTAALAADALGASHVKGVLLPSPYTSYESVEDANALATNLAIETFTVPINDAMKTFEKQLAPVFKNVGWMEDVAVGGNLQARLRGLTLMSLSNRFGWLLLSTGNKSEIATGYTTLYGDSCGGYNVVKDLYKTQIYALAHWRNREKEIIPIRSITKAPTAELKPNQTDQDVLPPYDMLDKILYLHVEERQSAAEIIAKGFQKPIVDKVLRMVRLSEYKRRQSAPGVKLSPMLFGKDRRYPLTNKYDER